MIVKMIVAEPNALLTDIKELPILKVGDATLELELRPPSTEMLETAKKELRETPQVQDDAIKKLKELLKAETNLKCPLDRDAWLIRFLRPNKYYPESALKLVKNYYNFKLKHDEKIYNDLRPSKERNIFQQNILTVLPNRDEYGRRVLIIELGKKWNHHECTLDEVFKGCVLYLEAAMLEPTSQIAGAVVIFDMDGLSLQQTCKFTPSFAKMVVDWLQDAMPLRIKNIHIINQPFIFNAVFNLFKPFLRPKLRNRIIFHGTDRKSLYRYLAPKYLPEIYGGTMSVPQITASQWLELLILCDKEYEAINSYGYNRS